MNSNITDFLRLVRFQNLLIVAATQYLMRHAIISPALGIYGRELQLGELHFFLLVLATLLITAAGYVINDYFDTRTDQLNRPGKVVVGRKISRRSAIIIHWILNFFAILIGFYLAFHIGVPLFGFSFIFVAGMLWFYSTTYNRQFLIGNLVIAFLTAMVPVMVILFEMPLLQREYGFVFPAGDTGLLYLFALVGSFGYFAFITTLIRELIKDVEDYEGDIVQGRKSVPIVLGIRGTRIIAGALVVLTAISLVFIYMQYLVTVFGAGRDYLSLLYFIIFLLIPLFLLLYKIASARKKSDYRSAQSLTKLIMLMGLMYSLVARYIIISVNI